MRRAEDFRALTMLRAKPIWLDFVETQYGPPPADEALAAAIEQTLDTPASAVAIPLGLFHRDHQLTHGAALTV
jgi:LmbE family N-acetylglucosaminyl deacetylase